MDFEKDPRMPCKYGDDCYQKNVQHKMKYKHPPPKQTQMTHEAAGRKRKADDAAQDISKRQAPEIKISEPSPPDNSAHQNGKQKEEVEVEEQEEIVPPSPPDIKDAIKDKFLLEMPEDFYKFWEFCQQISSEEPCGAFSVAGLVLVGPFDVLSGKLTSSKVKRRADFLCHWRYFCDPPEFQTVMAGSENDFHIGYFRDDPSEMPVFVGSMSSKKEGFVTAQGDNLFAATCLYLEAHLKKEDDKKVRELLKEVQTAAKDSEFSLVLKTQAMKQRDKKVVAKSFNGAGVVVPYDKKTDVGYREIPETNSNLRRMLKRITDATNTDDRNKRFDDLHELITNVQFANDEGDVGMGLELGLDLLAFGSDEFNSTILHLLTVAYDLLDRGEFAQIIKAHMHNRRRGNRLSAL